MFVVDKEKNTLTKIAAQKFFELGFREKEHLQEWLENNPEAFGEELLFIQKEFDGFDDTRERLDLLAIDRSGNLVIIENKLDDSGRDVTWQALKYTSYCSSLSKQQIKKIYQSYLNKKGVDESSENKILDFLNENDFREVVLNQTQRIILVSGSYRKEVTSTVLWLITKYNLKIQCFKATAFPYSGQTFLNLEQIIPVKEIEEYTIRMAEKIQEEQVDQYESKEIHKVRLEFWKQLLQKINTKSSLFVNVNPSKDGAICAGSGVGNVSFNLVVGKTGTRAEVYMSRSLTEENKLIFDNLYQQKNKIELHTGILVWERLNSKKACRIRSDIENVSLYKKEDWEKMTKFLIDNIIRIEQAFREPIQRINALLKGA